MDGHSVPRKRRHLHGSAGRHASLHRQSRWTVPPLTNGSTRDLKKGNNVPVEVMISCGLRRLVEDFNVTDLKAS
jgi:hypothetical protein